MGSNPPLLSDYLLQTRRLVHDSTGNYWPDPELIDYINAACFRVVADTGCNRVLQTINVTQAQETYAYAVLPSGVATIDVLNITLLWGSLRVPMTYMPFTEFNLKMRAWQTFQSRPVVFTVYGGNTVYVGPVPDQTYSTEWDTVVSPPVLVNYTDASIIPFPFSEPVPYYAAYLAKEKEQSTAESDRFLNTYTAKVKMAIRSSFTRRITTPFNM